MTLNELQAIIDDAYHAHVDGLGAKPKTVEDLTRAIATAVYPFVRTSHPPNTPS